MVSLGSNQRNSGGGFSFNPDVNEIFDETDEASLVSSVLVIDDEPHFRTIPLTGVILLEIFLSASLLVSAFLVPYYLEAEACFILSCAHALYWGIIFITSCYRHFHHSYIQKCGYLEFYRNTQILQKIPLLASSFINALLVACIAIFQKYCSCATDCPNKSGLQCHNYLQIIFGSEIVMLLFCLIKYLNLVVKFNKSKSIPDVHKDELLVNYSQSYAPPFEVGFRDEDYMEEVLEKQADMIRYLKQHSNNLSRKIMKLNTQLENLSSTAVKF